MKHPMIEFPCCCDSIIKFYPYRTAVVTDWVIKVEMTDDDLWWLHHMLEDSGYKMDNHIVFCTETGAFWLSDHELYVGKTVREGRY